MGLREEALELARSRGIELLGIARVSEIELAYPPRPAEDLLRGARSAIVFAAELLWGALNCPRGSKLSSMSTRPDDRPAPPVAGARW